MWPRIVTVGVYGFNEATFFAALRATGVDTFCDIRLRRGVRGREYAKCRKPGPTSSKIVRSLR